MGKVVASASMSLDGFSAGPEVSAEHPMGVGGDRLHEWLLHGERDTADAGVARHLAETIGAVVVGRRTYNVGVVIWGDTPYPLPTFVLTHEPIPDRPMASATFTFVTDARGALRQAHAAAGGKDVLVMGGAGVIQEFLRAGLVDEIRVQLVPVLLGAGTRLFDHLGPGHIELERTEVIASPQVTHLTYRVRRGAEPSRT